MKVEILKEKWQCKMCEESSMMFETIPNCQNCEKKYGILIEFITSFWGTYGIIQIEDRLEKIPLHRIRVIEKN